MKLLQLTSSDSGEQIGLYRTDRTDEYIEQDIENAFAEAIAEADNNDEVSPHDIADDLLEAREIVRVFADEIFVAGI
jgi:hypothetical protein